MMNSAWRDWVGAGSVGASGALSIKNVGMVQFIISGLVSIAVVFWI